MNEDRKRIPWISQLFKALRGLLEGIIKLTSRLVAAVIGLVIMLVCFVLTITFIAAPAVIPMMLLGFLLMVRGFFIYF